MKRYSVAIRRVVTERYCVTVEANNPREATNFVKKIIKDGASPDAILDGSNYSSAEDEPVETVFDVMELAS